jgi:hypothetical protein
MLGMSSAALVLAWPVQPYRDAETATVTTNPQASPLRAKKRRRWLHVIGRQR